MRGWNYWTRIDKRRRRLAIQAISALALAFVAIGLLISLPSIQRLDLQTTREIQETHGSPWDQLMFVASFLGGSATIVAMDAAVCAWLWVARRRLMAAFVLSSLVSLPIDLLLKDIWKRARPNPIAVHVLLPTSGSSFPSGHVLGSTVFYGFLAFLAWTALPGETRIAATFLLAILIPYIALSRIYVGAHWLSDVVGAFTMGLLLLVVLTTLYSSSASAEEPASESAP